MPEIIESDISSDSNDGEDYIYKTSDMTFNSRRFQIVYDVLADNPDQRESDILATPGIPILRQLIRGAWCRNRKAREVETGALLWKVTCDFDTQMDSVTDEETDPPNLRTPTWVWTSDVQDKVVEFYYNDAAPPGRIKIPIENTAQEKLIVTRPDPFAILTVTRYVTAFSQQEIYDYVGKFNLTTFWSAPKGAVEMLSITDEQEIIAGIRYRKNTYKMKFKVIPNPNAAGYLPETLSTIELLNEGTRYRYENPPGTFIEYRSFVDGSGNPRKGLLDEFGYPLGDTDDPVYLPFAYGELIDFNTLNLGPWP